MIYLLDDESDVLDFLGNVAEYLGFEAKKYSDANKCLDDLKSATKGSILVLDLYLPGMDGIEVMRSLAEQKSLVSIIIVSGKDSSVLSSSERLAIAHGLNVIATMSKPISLENFSRLLRQHVLVTSSKPINNRDACHYSPKLGDLIAAVNEGHLELYYQPQYSLNDGSLYGVEALLRWNHPEHGLIFPDKFIPMAERSGCIEMLTGWVIAEAICQAKKWEDLNFSLCISVNISAMDITSLTLPEKLSTLLKSSKLNPARLALEITETAVMDELVTFLDILTRLRINGTDLSIDDFGTGYSSLAQLHRLPFNELKIDRSFVINMLEDEEALSIVKTCIILGHELNMTVVAEGIETKEHMEVLCKLGCDRGQGYYFSRPLMVRDIDAMLESNVTLNFMD